MFLKRLGKKIVTMAKSYKYRPEKPIIVAAGIGRHNDGYYYVADSVKAIHSYLNLNTSLGTVRNAISRYENWKG